MAILRSLARALFVAGALFGLASIAHAAPPTPPSFDAQAATQAYLDSFGAAARARSDAYFEGGYIVQLVTPLFGILVAFLLLHLGVSAKLRDLAARMTKRPALVAILYFAELSVLLFVVTFPLDVWVDFVREHRYGLSNMSFAAWLADQGKSLLLNVVLVAPLVALLLAFVRAKPRTWWVWAAGVSSLFAVIMISVGPVFIEPLFNTYTPLPDSPLQRKILSLARSEGIPVTQVLVVDQSRQSNRVSAERRRTVRHRAHRAQAVQPPQAL